MQFEYLQHEARKLIEADGTIKLPKGMDRVLRDLALERGPLMYVAAVCIAAKDGLTAQLLSTHMTTDQAIRTAIGIQGQLSGVDLVLQSIIELMTPQPEEKETADERSGQH